MTTSSPGLHRVTPGPTFHTIPNASEPPMWWSSSGWYRKTETGLPSAAHTLLKFTPAAITRTVTSNAPGSGTSISSSRKASVGSPSRSARMTRAAIVAGSSPGSTSSCAIWLVSTDMARTLAAAGGGLRKHRVHGFHDRDGLVERHHRALEPPVGEAAGHLVGLIAQAARGAAVEGRGLAGARHQREAGLAVPALPDLDPCRGADDGRLGGADGRGRAGDHGLGAGRVSEQDRGLAVDAGERGRGE